MTISLSMIVKDGLDNLKRLKPLVEPYIDEWVVVLPPKDKAINWCKKNGIKTIVKDFTEPLGETAQAMRDFGIEVSEDYRLFNFAAARNEGLSNCTKDYILWLDDDDEPIGLERLVELLRAKPDYEYFDAVYDYGRDEEGNSISDHLRERIVKNNGKFKWKGGELGVIHETLIPNFTPKMYTIPKSLFHVRHISDHVLDSSDRNFIALLYEYLKTDPKDPRTIYYLGTELFNHGLMGEAIRTLNEFIEVGGWDEERYRGWLKIAEAYYQLRDEPSCRNAYLNAVKELPNYPDAYLGLGESYHRTSDWAKSIDFIMTGLNKPIPKTTSAIDMTKYTFRMMTYLALNYMQVGKLDEAYKWFQRAKKSNPNYPWIKQYEPMFDDLKDTHDYVQAFVKLGQLTKAKYPDKLEKLAEVIPDELQGQEILLNYKRRFSATKKWSDKSIVYFCSEAFEEWGADALKRGCGGSEEAVINLTERWAKLGWEVTVFNNCSKEETVNGVTWKRFETFNPRDDFNIVIGWRNNPFIDDIKARLKLLDAHDVPYEPRNFTATSLDDVTVMVKSHYHRTLFNWLPDENFKVVPNGINFKQFKPQTKIPNRLVWTSSYDRGLEYLLEMWADIRQAVPDATLDVAYGWNLWDKSTHAKTAQGQRWKAKMVELLEQDGIYHHGRLNSDEVAELYTQADVWAYPTDFPEIDCITATKAMKAGCVPITTDFAVMKERNQGIMVEGDIKDTKDRFKAELIKLLKDDKLKQTIRQQLDVSDYSWDKVADQWHKIFLA